MRTNILLKRPIVTGGRGCPLPTFCPGCKHRLADTARLTPPVDSSLHVIIHYWRRPLLLNGWFDLHAWGSCRPGLVPLMKNLGVDTGKDGDASLITNVKNLYASVEFDGGTDRLRVHFWSGKDCKVGKFRAFGAPTGSVAELLQYSNYMCVDRTVNNSACFGGAKNPTVPGAWAPPHSCWARSAHGYGRRWRGGARALR